MELCTAQAVSKLPHTSSQRLFIPNPPNLRYKPSLLPRRTSLSRTSRFLNSRLRYFSHSFPRASTSEETSNGVNKYGGEDRDGVVTVEDVPPAGRNVYNVTPTSQAPEAPKEESNADGQTQTFEILDNLNFDSGDTFSILFLGGGALVALWLASAIVGSIDSIPLFPKLMEVVGLGYTVWFTSRYLIFKESREELVSKFQELKQQVLGSSDD
ncbi:protein CURVATURE THYLAKOID 1D, chloroplastic [Ziziphus jujuba]|uniref:Protein CURVATURE THYLAKOID 1D, chloroplastic n=1 Tax=Ziziphus jujuba TaxID=326968 RepID=A0A6P4A9N4_ZIZJJ|nr:protein CURVATURE THYLAKOID 1D, chloroplastic [Ziziphus jujuba]